MTLPTYYSLTTRSRQPFCSTAPRPPSPSPISTALRQPEFDGPLPISAPLPLSSHRLTPRSRSSEPPFTPRSISSILIDDHETIMEDTISDPKTRTNGKGTSSPEVPTPIRTKKKLDQFSRDELVWRFRTTHEDEHFSIIRENSIWNEYHVSIDEENLGPPEMDLTHFQDTCNKSVAIYLGASDWQYRTLARIIFNCIYRRWYQPYRNDIYHQRYLAKLIALDGLPDPAASTNRGRGGRPRTSPAPAASRNRPDPCPEVIETVADMHRLLCHDADAMHAKGFDPENHFIVQPLFKSLFILVDPAFYHDSSSKHVGRMSVFLVKTGFAAGLSEPISFDSIERKIKSSYRIPSRGMEIVKTSLAVAIDLVMALEARENSRFGPNPNPYITHRHEAEERNKQLVERFGPEVELLPVGSLDQEWVDVNKYPEWEAQATAMPNWQAASVYDAGWYRYPQLVMVLQEQGGFNDEELRRVMGSKMPGSSRRNDTIHGMGAVGPFR